MKAPFCTIRRTWFGLTLLAIVALLVVTHAPLLRGMASFLIVQDPLEPAIAIVSLGGHTPFREMEAAKLYRAGLSPQVVIVGVAPSAETEALRELGFKTRQAWELSREVLIQQGVPASAISVLTTMAGGTLEELQAVYSAMTPKDAPVILVTSKYHTRRTRLTWQYVTAGKSQPIVRAATSDPFDPNHWWQRRSFSLSVVHEYFGLVYYYARFLAGGAKRGEVREQGERMRWLAQRAANTGVFGSLIDHHEESHGAGRAAWQGRAEFPFGIAGIE